MVQIAGGILLALSILWILKLAVLWGLNYAISDKGTAAAVPAGSAPWRQDDRPAWKQAVDWGVGFLCAYAVALAGLAAVVLILGGIVEIAVLISH
jgi:hypothetical protein